LRLPTNSRHKSIKVILNGCSEAHNNEDWRKKRAKKKFRSPKAKLIFMNFFVFSSDWIVCVLWNMWRRTWKTKLLKKSPFTLINCIKFFIFLQADLHEAICTLRCVIVHHKKFILKFLLRYGQLVLLWRIGMVTWGSNCGLVWSVIWDLWLFFYLKIWVDINFILINF